MIVASLFEGKGKDLIYRQIALGSCYKEPHATGEILRAGWMDGWIDGCDMASDGYVEVMAVCCRSETYEYTSKTVD